MKGEGREQRERRRKGRSEKERKEKKRKLSIAMIENVLFIKKEKPFLRMVKKKKN